MVHVEAIRCLSDNYAYLLADGDDGYLVDPSEVGPPADALAERGLTLRGILLTHHHWDHVGGVTGLLDAPGTPKDVWVAGHASDRGRIERQTHFIDAPKGSFVDSGLCLGELRLEAMHIPGHTTGAVAWLLRDDGETHCFTGDTLFAAGCGRLFEGTPADMYDSLTSLVALPDHAKLWFGHEYTAANLAFAHAAEPDNAAVTARQEGLPARTTPTTVADEKATNPFVRAHDAAQLAQRRQAKDTFRA